MRNPGAVVRVVFGFMKARRVVVVVVVVFVVVVVKEDADAEAEVADSARLRERRSMTGLVERLRGWKESWSWSCEGDGL